ncbi:Fc.00g010540.m01.CDS01 [Cosmosporella sp. VM-42]
MDSIRFFPTSGSEPAPSPANYQSTGLTFVSIDRPDQIRDSAKQRRIRRHVMKSIGLSRRRESLFNSRNSRSVAVTPTLAIPDAIMICPYWRNIYLAIGLMDDGAQRLCLEAAAVDFERLENFEFHALQKGLVEHNLQQYNQSLEFIKDCLAQSGDRPNTYAAVGTIIGLAFYDMRVRNFARWVMHMDGLESIIQKIGGLDMLNSFHSLQQALFCAEVLGSLVIDAPPPRFSKVRAHLFSRASVSAGCTTISNISLVFRTRHPFLVDLSEILTSLSGFTDQVGKFSRKEMTDHPLSPTDFAKTVLSLAYDLLALLRYENSAAEDPWSGNLAMREAIRLAALMFVAAVISHCSYDELFCARNYQGRMRKLITASQNCDWSDLEELKLWMLVISAVIEKDEERSWFISQIKATMQQCRLRTWDQVNRLLEEIAWIKNLAVDGVKILGTEVEADFTHVATSLP